MNLWKRGCILIALFVFASLLVGAAPQGDKKDSSASPTQKADNGKREEAKGDPAKGKQVFADNCQLCHNADSEKAAVGPGLKGLFTWPPHKMSDGTEHKEHTVAIIRQQIMEGGGEMAPMGASFSDTEVADLIAYLQTL